MMKIGVNNLPSLLEVRSEVKTIQLYDVINEEAVLEQLRDFPSSPIYWQSADKATFGLLSDGRLTFADYEPAWQHLHELRIFTKDSELHIWKYENSYFGRLIIDISYEAAGQVKADSMGNCFEHTVKLWGSQARQKGDFIETFEERGMNLVLPIKWENRFEEVGINVFLRERLYLKPDDKTGCVYFVDRRFCGLLVAEENGKLIEISDYNRMAVK